MLVRRDDGLHEARRARPKRSPNCLGDRVRQGSVPPFRRDSSGLAQVLGDRRRIRAAPVDRHISKQRRLDGYGAKEARQLRRATR